MKSEETSPAKPRSRKKAPATAASPIEPTALEPVVPAAPTAAAPKANVGEMESVLSLFAGVLLVITALFPRSIKQLLLLTLGGGFLYRGITSKCHVYELIGFDTARDSLVKQINERFLSSTAKSGK